MSKMQQVQKDMMVALKNKEIARKDALSLLLSALKAKWKDKRADLTEDEENAIILREIKQTKETMESAKGREDIIEECKLRLEIFSAYAPAAMSEDEIRETLRKVLAELHIETPTARERGILMKNLMPIIGARADGATVSRILGEFIQK